MRMSPGFYSASPDDATFRYLAHTYADNHGRMARGVACDPRDNFPGGVTNGAQWYDVPGGMQVDEIIVFLVASTATLFQTGL